MLLGAMLCTQNTWAAALPSSPRLAIPGSVVTSQRVVALTFDDGPSSYTPQILSVLRTVGAHATFFEIGRQVVQYPALVRDVVAAGDEVGNHTYTHADLLLLSNGSIRAQLSETQAVIQAAAGVTPIWFHPPDGAIDARVAAVGTSTGLRSVLWSVDPRDWSRPGVTIIMQRVLSAVRPGSIVLLHDGGGDRSETVAALRVILRTLQQEGYQFLTLSALFHVPSAPPCHETRAAQWFAAAGIAPAYGHALYQTWLQAYCQGENFGPATSPEYAVTPTMIAQDFARTAHRLTWDETTGEVSVTLMWSWAARVFAARGIEPHWHSPITGAWFDQYFHGHNWGPALEESQDRQGGHIQCFVRACAVEHAGRVTWQT